MSKVFTILVAGAAIVLLQPHVASAHCDALDGPVVNAAKAALDRNDVALVLRWVPPAREALLRAGGAPAAERQQLSAGGHVHQR